LVRMNTAHSDRDLGGDYGQNDMLGFNATGPTHRNLGGDPRRDLGELGRSLT